MSRIRNVAVMLLILSAGCVQRSMTVTSNPAGALVYMNGQEIGRTPFTRDFTWYGTYDVQVRAEGYETLDDKTKVIAPFWQWFPIDFFTEFLPVRDQHYIKYDLKPASTQPADPAEMIARGAELSRKLESSKYPRTTPAARARP